jgi:hypothetical protein
VNQLIFSEVSSTWNKGRDGITSKIEGAEQKQSKLEADAEIIGSLALQLQRSPFARIRITSNLDSLYKNHKNTSYLGLIFN